MQGTKSQRCIHPNSRQGRPYQFTKTNGNKIPAYICPYRNPLTYWIVKDSEGKIIKSVFEDEKDSLFNFEKEGFSIELFEYKGCPYWLQKESADSFFSNYS